MNTPSSLEEKVSELSKQVDTLTGERDAYRKLYLQMVETCRRLEQGLLGQKRERLSANDGQLTLAILSELLSGQKQPQDQDVPVEPVKAHTRRKPTGRKPLPENLPRVDIEIVPPEVQQDGLAAFVQIGKEVTEVIERRPASVVVVRINKPKFVRKNKKQNAQGPAVLVGQTPELPIERGLAGPGMLADTIVRRWQDHLPLNRLEGIYARDGIEIARSTICTWHDQLASLCQPLISAMKMDALNSPYLCTDATGVLVQHKERCRRGHFWVLVAPERHILYQYSKKHNGEAVDHLLEGYAGYLVADAHAVYDHLYKKGDVTEVGCWAHTRRYFFKALSSDPDRARHALALINGLFRIERQLASAPRKKRRLGRKQNAAPIVDKFFDWCDAEVDKVLSDTPIAQGIGYARNQRDALKRFLADGQLPIHNNVSELSLRRQVIGRKNWLFVGSDNGGEINCVFVSLLASCQLHQIEPWAYLRDLLCLLPSWPARQILDLAPACWRQTLQHTDAQQRLAANPFRAVTLTPDGSHPEK